MQFGFPHLMMFSAKMFALCRTTSLAISNEPSGNSDKASVDFPPGAAHMSNATTGSFTYSLNTCDRNIEDASCT